ncbi:ATP synthase F1 subunit delta [bacterium]|nr:ATP synthase F1 subunit delta [bacterium]
MNSDRVVAAKYARALLELAMEKASADQVKEDMTLMTQYFGDQEGKELLVNPLLEAGKKVRIVSGLLEGKVHPLSLSLLKLLIEKRRGALVKAVAESYEKEWLVRQNKNIAKVITAIPLTREQISKLRMKLQTIYEGELEVQEQVEPGLKAGARIEMDDLHLDGTLAGRLAKLRRVLSSDN